MVKKTAKLSKNDDITIDEFNLKPKDIVSILDGFIVGQGDAKKAVAIALRNRWRRKHLPDDLKNEVYPKNIIMIGPTGVGKTEIARRLSKISNSPFLKVEASRFTEVGYVGRDVESIIRDLTHISYNMVQTELKGKYAEKAERKVEERLLDLLLPGFKKEEPEEDKASRTRDILLKKLRDGKMEDREIEMSINTQTFPQIEILSNAGFENMKLMDFLPPGLMPSKKKKTRMKIRDAREYLMNEETEKLIDQEEVKKISIDKVENYGIVFLDEIDKISHKESGHGPDVSREGVQRDILPIVEGTTVNTKFGIVKTDNILFIAAGAFHVSKPSELIPELQGRFPIRVHLSSLSKEDFCRILKEPENALIKQYKALMKTESVNIDFDEDAIDMIAEMAFTVNEQTENIGARRLYTIMEKLLEEISFNAQDLKDENIRINEKYVKEKLQGLIEDQNLSKFIL